MFKMTVADLTTFSKVFAMMVMLFGLLNINLGMDQPTANSDKEGDYTNVNGYLQYMLQSLRVSVGDLQPPSYGKWSDMVSEDKFAYTMIGFLWISFTMQIFVMMVVVVNFLISLVGESYGKARSDEAITKLDQRAQMVEESMIHNHVVAEDKEVILAMMFIILDE